MISNFIYILRKHLRSLLSLVLLSGIVGFAMATTDPIALQLLIDEALMKKQLGLFVILVAAILLVGAGIRIAYHRLTVITRKLQNQIARDCTLHMLDVYYRIPFSKIHKNDKGYFVSRIYDEPKKISDTIVGLVNNTVGDFVMLVSALAVSFYLTWKVTLVLLLIVPILYSLSNRFSAKIKNQSVIENEMEAKTREGITETLQAYKTVRLFSLLPVTLRYVQAHLDRFLDALLKRTQTSSFFYTASTIVLSVAESSVLVLTAVDVLTGSLTLGGMMGYMRAFWHVIYSASGLINRIPEYSKMSGYIERLRELESMVENGPRLSSNEVLLEGASFGFNGKRIFDKLTMGIRAGEKVLVIGPNGSGKTTLLNLLSGFFEVDGGKIQSPSESRISALIEPFSFVPGSLRDNLRLGNGTEDGRVSELINEFKLRDKLDESPATFSLGQKKKAYILMTLLKDADIYMLDEPLAGIDDDSRKTVMSAILENARRKTLIMTSNCKTGFEEFFDRNVYLSESELMLP